MDPERVPAAVAPLLPLVEKWGIGDDVERSRRVEEASADELRALIAAVDAVEHDALYEWLAGPESFAARPTVEYVAITNLTMAADEARLLLARQERGLPWNRHDSGLEAGEISSPMTTHSRAIEVDDDFIAIATEIVGRHMAEHQWAERESDDEFQLGRYVGGYDAGERAFCFSATTRDAGELWFQLDLAEMAAVADGSVRSVVARPAE